MNGAASLFSGGMAGEGGVNESANADADGGDEAGVAALADAAAHDVENGWARDSKNNERRTNEKEVLRMARKHESWMLWASGGYAAVRSSGSPLVMTIVCS